MYILFTVSAFVDPEHFALVILQTVGEPYPNRTYGFAYPVGCGSLWQGCRLCHFTCPRQFIEFTQGSHIKVLVTVWCFKKIVGFRVAKGSRSPIYFTP